MLPSRIQAIRDRTIAAVDTIFAEPVKLSFMKGGEVDPARPAIQIDAVLRVGGGTESSVSGRPGGAWRSKLSAGRAEVHIDAATYAGPAFRSGDRVRALSRRGQPWFEVLRVDDRGDGRIVLELGEV